MNSPAFTRVILLPKKDRSIRLFHPWIFSGAIGKVEGKPAEGDIVEVFSSEKEYLATGHFHEGSIKVRIFSFEQTDAAEEFWYQKLLGAYVLRERLGLVNNSSTTAYRLVHAEGDGLPGLIIDCYDSVAVIQTHTIGMDAIKPFLVEALKKIYGKKLKTIFDKSTDTMNKQSAVQQPNQFLFGEGDQIIIKENDILFNVNWVEGQKTGFFLDQRDNRALLAKYSEGKKVLNTFAYSGGFSMYALKANASLVHSVDSSKKAEKMALQNAELNGVSDRHEFFAADAFDYLKQSTDKYDLIILDPPAFAKHLNATDKAMIGYRNLNTEGFKRIGKGGIIFTFSCSQAIDKTLFRKVVFQAAAQAKRNVRVLYQLSQGPDHPINIYHPEGEYLKGLVLSVD